MRPDAGTLHVQPDTFVLQPSVRETRRRAPNQLRSSESLPRPTDRVQASPATCHLLPAIGPPRTQLSGPYRTLDRCHPDQFLTELTGGASLGGMFWPAGATERAPGILSVGSHGGCEGGADRNARSRPRLAAGPGRTTGRIPREPPRSAANPTSFLGERHELQRHPIRTVQPDNHPGKPLHRAHGMGCNHRHHREPKRMASRNRSAPDVSAVKGRQVSGAPAVGAAGSRKRAASGADLTFVAAMDSTGVSVEPDWSIKTWQQVLVKPDTTMKLDELSARYAEPLVAFTSFVSDRPDSITSEVLRTEAGQRVSVLQSPRIRCLSAALEAGPPIPVSHRGPDEPSGGDQPVVLSCSRKHGRRWACSGTTSAAVLRTA